MPGTWHKRTGISIVVVVIAMILGRSAILRLFEPTFLTTGPNGPETPASVGLAFERVKIPSNGRSLDAYVVEASPTCQPKAAVLIFHGVMETISEWVKAQRFLYDRCVSSVVFDYSGHGDSSRPGNIPNLNQDSAAAYLWFASRFNKSGENETRLCVLGHSMGNGTMLEALPGLQPAPACVVVANAFSSLREEGGRSLRGPLRLLLYIMPDEWNNVKNVARNHVPLLLIHSDTDPVIPFAMGQQVFAAANEPKQMVALHGFKHNALYRTPSEEWWGAVIPFLRGGNVKPEAGSSGQSAR